MNGWIIICTDEGSDGELFWSNDQGWVSIEDATVFTGIEADTFNLPMGGAWIQLEGRDRARIAFPH